MVRDYEAYAAAAMGAAFVVVAALVEPLVERRPKTTALLCVLLNVLLILVGLNSVRPLTAILWVMSIAVPMSIAIVVDKQKREFPYSYAWATATLGFAAACIVLIASDPRVTATFVVLVVTAAASASLVVKPDSDKPVDTKSGRLFILKSNGSEKHINSPMLF